MTKNKWIFLMLVFIVLTHTGCIHKEKINGDAEAFLKDAEGLEVEDLTNNLPRDPRDTETQKIFLNENRAFDQQAMGIHIGVSGRKEAWSLMGLSELDKTGPSDVSVEIIPSQEVMHSKLINEEIEVAVLPIDLAVQFYNEGVQYKLAGIIGWGAEYLVSTEPIQSLGDIGGKTVYIMKESKEADAVLRYCLSNYGIIPDENIDLQWVRKLSDIEEFSVDQEQSAFILEEPSLSVFLEQYTGYHIAIDFQQEWIDATNSKHGYPQYCVYVSTAFINNDPQRVKTLLERIEKSASWIYDNVEFVSEMPINNQRLQLVNIEDFINRSGIHYYPADEVKEEIENYLRIHLDLLKTGTDKKMPDEAFYYTTQ